ncbi:MAG: hypothetical protein ACI86M_001797 [Saprospiraceae bacterium]|jgi:hypothetical protein
MTNGNLFDMLNFSYSTPILKKNNVHQFLVSSYEIKHSTHLFTIAFLKKIEEIWLLFFRMGIKRHIELL